MYYEKEMNNAIGAMLNKNALLLFSIENIPLRLDYQRHVCETLSEVPGNNKKDKVLNSVIMAIHLWFSWDIHAQKSTYPYDWYGCVQVEDDWLLKDGKTPPYVIFNSIKPYAIMNFQKFQKESIANFPLDIYGYRVFALRKIITKLAVFDEDGSKIWRICFL